MTSGFFSVRAPFPPPLPTPNQAWEAFLNFPVHQWLSSVRGERATHRLELNEMI